MILAGFKIGVHTTANARHLLTPSGGERFATQNEMVQENEKELHRWTKEQFEKNGDFISKYSVGVVCIEDVFMVNVLNSNDAPYFNPALSDQLAVEDDAFVYDVNASDVDLSTVLSYSSNISVLGGSIDQSTGVIHWTPTKLTCWQ